MKKKKELLVIGILIGIFCVVGASFAIWQVTHVQTGENSLTVGCFKVEFTDANPIQIGKAYPIEDNVGKTLTPYEFTITNTCNDLAAYQINLEVLNDSTMNEYSYIKSMLDEENPNLLTTNQVVQKTLENASTAYKLKKSYLNANETKNFTLRLWLDKNTPADETIMNSVFKSKVTVTTSYIDEAPLASGTLRSVSSNDSNGLWQYRGQITKLIIEDELKPIEGAIASFDESSTQDKSVISYIVENPKLNEEEETTYTVYLQSNEKLYLQDGYYLFYNFTKLETIEGMRYIDTSKVRRMSGMFDGCSSLTDLDLSNFNTSNVTSMFMMFNDCSNLTALNVSSFNTINVIDMSYVFNRCKSLTTLDLGNFDTSNVTNMSSMFSWCSSLTSLDLSNFNTENVTDMTGVFLGCSGLTNLDLSPLNTTNVTNMRRMFAGCSSLTNLDLSPLNTTNVTNMSSMFSSCSSLTNLDLSPLNTTNVTNMSGIFSGCSSLTELNLSNFNTSQVQGTERLSGFYQMFWGCSKLNTINYGDNFVYASDANVQDMFLICPANKPTHESWTGVL